MSDAECIASDIPPCFITFRKDSISGGSSASQSYNDSVYQGQGSNGFYNDTNLDVDATL